MTGLAIVGVAGRMGRAILREARADATFTLVGALDSQRSGRVGQDAGEVAGLGAIGLAITEDLPAALAARPDVVIDFSHASALPATLSACVARRVPLLVGTTGYAPELEREFEAAASRIPLIVAANTSLGVTLLIELVRDAAAHLPADFDIEIVEAHHRLKKDAPSGTALALGAAAATGRGAELSQVAAWARHGEAARAPGEIGFAVIRGGDLVGEHRVILAGTGEQLVLEHRATDRAVFARGALTAARWLAGRSPGRYFMRDVLGIKNK